MEYVLMFAVQAALLIVAVVVINRKLLLQNIALRNQLGVYLRTIEKKKIKSQIRNRDRRLWILLKKFLDDWSDYLVIVKPEAVIEWERRRFNRFWIKKSQTKGKVGRPRIADQHIEFIRRISGDHPEMGSQKIADELFLKFGYQHSPETIRKYRLPRRSPRGEHGAKISDSRQRWHLWAICISESAVEDRPKNRPSSYISLPFRSMAV